MAFSNLRAVLAAASWFGMILVSACGTVQPTAPGLAAVPWIDRVGVPSVQLASNSVASRGCVARDIHVDVGAVGAYMGMVTQELVVHSVAPDACLVPAAPAMTVVLANGQSRSVSQRASTSVVGATNGFDGLASGGSIHVLIGTPAVCAAAGTGRNVARSLRLSLSAKEVITVAGTYIDVFCGDPVLISFDLDQPAVASVPESSFSATIRAPKSVGRGGTLTYFVTLSNPTSTTIVLEPCPSYTQSIGVVSVFRQTLLLNCGAVGSIPAGGNVTFEMLLAIPSNLAPGASKLGWHLEVPNGAFAGSVVTVT